MTLDGLMDAMKGVFLRAASGPLRDAAWRAIRSGTNRDLSRLLRQNPSLASINYQFHVVVDSNGGQAFHSRSIATARETWLRTLVGRAAPEHSLETSGTIRRSGGGRPICEMSVTRRSPGTLAIGRGTSDPSAGVRPEGSRAVVRGGTVDAEALARLSRGLRGTTGARRAAAPLPADPATASAGTPPR